MRAKLPWKNDNSRGGGSWGTTVDGSFEIRREKPVEVGSLSHYFPGFITSEVVIAAFLPLTRWNELGISWDFTHCLLDLYTLPETNIVSGN